jgi:hypothetical protein
LFAYSFSIIYFVPSCITHPPTVGDRVHMPKKGSTKKGGDGPKSGSSGNQQKKKKKLTVRGRVNQRKQRSGNDVKEISDLNKAVIAQAPPKGVRHRHLHRFLVFGG